VNRQNKQLMFISYSSLELIDTVKWYIT